MEYDFQRAALMKRLPAWMLDGILLMVAAVGFMALWSLAFDPSTPTAEFTSIMEQYDTQFAQEVIAEYEKKNGVKWPEYYTNEEEWAKLTEQQQQDAQALAEEVSAEVQERTGVAIRKDERAMELFAAIISNWFSIISLGVLCAYTILEFAVPLLLKNGQTIGKKCFGIALMRKDGIKATTFMVFARTILGKCTVETMLPLTFMAAGLMFSSWIWLIAGAALVVAPAIMVVFTKDKTAIHDLMACTVAVDLSSQMIFDSVEEMEAYHAEIRESAAAWKD